MFSAFEIEMQSEFNAQYDSVREAYAATQLDPMHEGYCDYLMSCEDAGVKPTPFAQWVVAQNDRRSAASPVMQPTYGDDEIPF